MVCNEDALAAAAALGRLLSSLPAEPESEPATPPADHVAKPVPAPPKPEDGSMSAHRQSGTKSALMARRRRIAVVRAVLKNFFGSTPENDDL